MNNKLITLTLCISTLMGCGGSAVSSVILPTDKLKEVREYSNGSYIYRGLSDTCYSDYRGRLSIVICEDFLGESEQTLRDKRSHKQQAEQYSELLRKLWNEKVDSKCEYGHTWPLSQDSQYGYTAWSRAFEREIDCAEPDLQQIAEEKALLETLKKKYEK